MQITIEDTISEINAPNQSPPRDNRSFIGSSKPKPYNLDPKTLRAKTYYDAFTGKSREEKYIVSR